MQQPHFLFSACKGHVSESRFEDFVCLSHFCCVFLIHESELTEYGKTVSWIFTGKKTHIDRLLFY